MKEHVDAAVIGAGPNGLTCAAMLARAGRRVVVLERCELAGGLAGAESFHDGFTSAGILHDTECLDRRVARELELERHGLRWRPRPPLLAAGAEGPGLLLSGDAQRDREEIARLAPADADKYAGYRRFLADAANSLRPLLTEVPPRLPVAGGGWGDVVRRAWALRRTGRDGAMELARVVPMALADWLGEWFTSQPLKAALAAPALTATWAGPWSPATAANLLRLEALRGPDAVAGGGPALVQALRRCAEDAGAQIRTSATVHRVIVEGGRVRGVALQGGEELHAPLVAASCDPRQTFLELLPPESVPPHLAQLAASVRMRGTTAVIDVALRGGFQLACRPEHPVEAALLGAEHLDDLERAFDPVKYGAIPQSPVLDVLVSGAEGAPPDHSVLSIHAHFVPMEADHGALERVVRQTLEAHAPGLGERIVAFRARTPADLEQRFGLTGGHLHHGEHGLDQMIVRPFPAAARYRTPIEGLLLAGSGSHPGGGLTLLPGALAARTALRGSL